MSSLSVEPEIVPELENYSALIIPGKKMSEIIKAICHYQMQCFSST